MVDTGAGAKNIFFQLEQIQISDMHHQEYVYYGLLVIHNVVNQVLPNPLWVSDIQNLAKIHSKYKILWKGDLRYDSNGD